MLERLVKDWLVGYLKDFIEDFDEEEGLIIDSWNGTIQKHNIVFKKDALEHLGLSGALGAPIDISKGACGLLFIEIPFFNLRSRPCKIKLKDLHWTVQPSGNFDKAFAARIDHAVIKKKFKELLEKMQVSINARFLVFFPSLIP